VDVQVAGEAAREMEKVARALHHAAELVAGVDRARAALDLTDREQYSALRTAVEQAQTSAQRVLGALRSAAQLGDTDGEWTKS
jgi:hypothetical protein